MRELIIGKLADKDGEIPSNNNRAEVSVVDKTIEVRNAVVRAIMHRDDSSVELKDGDRQFMGGSLLDTAREVLITEGIDVRGLHGEELAKRALHSSSDFALILAAVSNKSLEAAYAEAPQTFAPFTRERSAKDFKELSTVQLGEGSGLEKVLEGGEYKRGTLSESAEKYKVEKYGKVLGLTWELLINDDLDAFARIPAILGRHARDLESELIWKIITDNGNMADGNALFSAAHGNLAAVPAVQSVTSYGVARAAMRLQTDIDGKLINLSAKHVVVPAALETLADQLTSSINPTVAGEVNPFSNRLSPISEPRLDASSAISWYMMATKAQIDMFELARLGGKGPEIFTREGFDIDGMETKIRYVFGVKAINWRGMFKNAGA